MDASVSWLLCITQTQGSCPGPPCMSRLLWRCLAWFLYVSSSLGWEQVKTLAALWPKGAKQVPGADWPADSAHGGTPPGTPCLLPCLLTLLLSWLATSIDLILAMRKYHLSPCDISRIRDTGSKLMSSGSRLLGILSHTLSDLGWTLSSSELSSVCTNCDEVILCVYIYLYVYKNKWISPWKLLRSYSYICVYVPIRGTMITNLAYKGTHWISAQSHEKKTDSCGYRKASRWLY